MQFSECRILVVRFTLFHVQINFFRMIYQQLEAGDVMDSDIRLSSIITFRFYSFKPHNCSDGFAGCWPAVSLHSNVRLLASVFPYSPACLLFSGENNFHGKALSSIYSCSVSKKNILQEPWESLQPWQSRGSSLFPQRKSGAGELQCPDEQSKITLSDATRMEEG